MNIVDKLRKGKSRRKHNLAKVATGTYDGDIGDHVDSKSDKLTKPVYRERNKSFVSKVTGLDLANNMTGEERLKKYQAKMNYKKFKQAQKTKRAKWTTAGTSTASTGASVAGAVTGAAHQPDTYKTYEYNIFVDKDKDNINNMQEAGKDSGTGSSTNGSTIVYYLGGGDR